MSEDSESKKQTELEKQKAAKRNIRYLNDLKSVLSAPEGRRIMWRLMGDAGVFRSSFAIDPYSTAFNEGKRNAGLILYRDVFNNHPELMMKMRKEYISDQLVERETYLGVKEDE